MELSFLIELGLTEREAKVYVALLEVGPCRVGMLIKRSGVPGSKVYEMLDRLKERGLASSIVRDGRQVFSAEDPQVLVRDLDERRAHLTKTVVPQLHALRNKERANRSSVVLEGLAAIKTIYERMLDLPQGEFIYVLGAPVVAQEKLGAFLLDFQKRRLKKGLRMKLIYVHEARQYGKSRERLPFTEVRYLKEGELSPAWVDVFGDYVAIFTLSERPSAVLIEDKDIAQSFKTYFEATWASLSR